MGKIIFVTGTDTGVGKTVLTSMLLAYLRSEGIKALALKPFCSGGREDALLLHSFQSSDISLDEVNPFHFKKPLAPYIAATSRERKKIRPASIVRHIKQCARRCDLLLVEGAGGLLVPLGKTWFVLDLIEALECEVILVAANKLGAINHTLLSIKALEERVAKNIRIVLMEQKHAELCAETNTPFIAQILKGKVVVSIGYLGVLGKGGAGIRGGVKRFKKDLARLVGSYNFSNVLSNARNCDEK